MKRIKRFENFYGNDYTKMVNNALGINLKTLMSSGYDMYSLGVDCTIAWFVYMNGNQHGYWNDLKWRNYVTEDYNFIIEKCVDENAYSLRADMVKYMQRRQEYGFLPYRYAFQIDPYNNDRFNNNCSCKFLGAFRIKQFLSNDMSTIKYEKVFDNACFKSIGDGFSPLIDTKENFLKGADKYKIKIEDMGFSETALTTLLKGNIKTAGDLLELTFEERGGLYKEVTAKLYELFK